MITTKTMLVLSSLAVLAPMRPQPAVTHNICELTALQMRAASRNGARADLRRELAVCANISNPFERIQCIVEAYEGLLDGLIEADEQFDARTNLCGALDSGPYDPDIDPDDFVAVIDNPFFPLIPGAVRTYQKTTDEGVETVEVTVTSDTREILGVECTIVRDIVSLDGGLVEDTLDFYAQDKDGNVWYFGEVSRDFDEQGFLVSIDGSFLAGRDGAKAGILMEAAPCPGDTYRQEFDLGNAEDIASVLSLVQSVSVPVGDFDDCLQTFDFTPLDGESQEHKFYAAGIGPVLEIDLLTGERLELVSFTP